MSGNMFSIKKICQCHSLLPFHLNKLQFWYNWSYSSYTNPLTSRHCCFQMNNLLSCWLSHLNHVISRQLLTGRWLVRQLCVQPQVQTLKPAKMDCQDHMMWSSIHHLPEFMWLHSIHFFNVFKKVSCVFLCILCISHQRKHKGVKYWYLVSGVCLRSQVQPSYCQRVALWSWRVRGWCLQRPHLLIHHNTQTHKQSWSHWYFKSV